MTDTPHVDLTLRLATPDDELQLLDLVQQANWNQIVRDWHNLMNLATQGVWVMDEAGKAVASMSVITYPGKPGHSMAWIGMLIVDANHRRMGIATRLLHHAVNLALQRCEGVKLDATEDGQKVYRQHGFVDEYTLVRLTADTVTPLTAPPQNSTVARIQPMRSADLDAVIAMDRVTFGANREALLRQIFVDAPHLAWTAWQDHTLAGFCLGRIGRRFTQIGPVQAQNERMGIELVRSAVAQAEPGPVVVDVVESHTLLTQTLSQMGFTLQRRLYRMYYKANSCSGRPEHSLAIAGYEFG